MIPTLNEGSRSQVTARFYDNADNPQLPNTVDYRLDCETTGQVILDWTAVPPAAVVSILVTADLNAIINPNNPVERKVLTVMANRLDITAAFNEVQKWDLIRLQGL